MAVTAGVSSASVMDLQATRPFGDRSGQALSLQKRDSLALRKKTTR
jgi:hypothetical protein